MTNEIHLVIITGMSGAGKTVAMQSFEDLGYFCIDNMPPSLLPKFWDLVRESGKLSKIALVIDLRSRAFYDEIVKMLNDVAVHGTMNAQVLFLDASDEELVSRYKRPGVPIHWLEMVALWKGFNANGACYHQFDRQHSWSLTPRP